MRAVNYIEIGKRLKQLRGPLSQREFAKKIGISYRAYQNYEVGKRIPHVHVLSKIAEIFNTTTDWILTGLADIEKARKLEALKRTHIVEELLERLEGSLEREEKLIYKYIKGRAAAEKKEKLGSVDEKLFIQLLRKWIKEDKQTQNAIFLDKKSPLYLMFKQLERIYNEGDEVKMNAIKAQLNAFDPGKKI